VPKDLYEVTVSLAAELLVNSGRADDFANARDMIEQKLKSGEAMDKFREMVSAQGGDLTKPLIAATSHQVSAKDNGVVHAIDTEALGLAIIEMGGGRKVVGQNIDHSVGIQLNVRLGDDIETGDTLATVYTDDHTENHIAAVRHAITITPPTHACSTNRPLILDRISS